MGPPDAITQAIVLAAQSRGIAVRRLGPDFVEIGRGATLARFVAGVPSTTSHVAVRIARDLPLTCAILYEAGLPVPAHEGVLTAGEAVAAANRLGGAVTLVAADAPAVPQFASALASVDEVRAVFERLRTPRAIVARHLEGAFHRAFVVAGRLVALTRFTCPETVGDGRRTVRELVEAAPGGGATVLDARAEAMLARQGLSADAIPPAGMRVALHDDPCPAHGGGAEDVTAAVHPRVAAACARAAAAVGLEVCGVDLACREVSRPLEEQGGGILRVAAGADLATYAGARELAAIGEAILQLAFPGNGVESTEPGRRIMPSSPAALTHEPAREPWAAISTRA